MPVRKRPVDLLLPQRSLHEARLATEVPVGDPELYVSSEGVQRDANEAAQKARAHKLLMGR
jgi:hypothetical protein